MTMPNFLIIGAFKGGTASLWYFLKQHPEIFMSPVKESRYFSYMNKTINYNGPGDKKFNNDKVTTLERYKNLYKSVTGEKTIGEASSIYLYNKDAAENIRSSLPDVKLIVCLKNPVERAYSNYIQKRRNGEEYIKDFNKALLEETKRKKNNFSPAWYYIEKGFYYNVLKNYFDIFRIEQFKIYT
ncbi:MAG: sulfotransferase domain-containing protein, partial [Thermodesulfobacteriota bacterium]